MVFEIIRLNRFCINVPIAQLIECLTGEQEDPNSILRKGEKIFTLIPFHEEMIQMVNKNKSSNSLVFGRWPQP